MKNPKDEIIKPGDIVERTDKTGYVSWLKVHRIVRSKNIAYVDHLNPVLWAHNGFSVPLDECKKPK